jgi:L,D-transpeptidase catalytic domain
MNRLTWSGIALHAGNLPGYPASHGCVRLPLQVSEMLFGITKLGMTVVLADETSQPASVVHPGLVLGDYARREFAAVDTVIKRNQYSEGHAEKPHSVSVVVSGHDSSLTIFENGNAVARGKVKIATPGKPLPYAVHTLHGASGETGEIPCAREKGQPMGRCEFGVTREGNGTGMITVFWPDGGNRVIFFESNRPASNDQSQADGDDKMNVSESAGLFAVTIGDQRFELPDAVMTGG